MSNFQQLPTESELYAHSNKNKNKNDFITMNIYNHPEPINEESNADTNQTETNLNIEDNNKMNDPLTDLRQKAMYLDNRRENQYPLSENRGVNQPPAPETKLPNNYNYSKTISPYNQTNIYVNNYNPNPNQYYNANNVPISTEKELELKSPYIQSNRDKNKVKKKKEWKTSEIIICILLFFLYPPAAICYYCCFVRKRLRRED